MSLKDDAVANVKGYVKGMAKFLTPTDENNKPITLTPSIDTTPQKPPGVEHAQGLAAKYQDSKTAASTVGVHPMEAHFAASPPRHQLGRYVPK